MYIVNSTLYVIINGYELCMLLLNMRIPTMLKNPTPTMLLRIMLYVPENFNKLVVCMCIDKLTYTQVASG